MRTRVLASTFISAISILLMLSSWLLAQQQPAGAIRVDSVFEDEKELDAAIEENEALLSKYPDVEFSPTVMFQLSELYARKAELDYQRRMSVYEEELEKFDKGLLPVEPSMPRITLQKTILLASQLLERFPNIEFKDRVLYRLAISHLDEGNREKARHYFERLVTEKPNSPVIPEANFRLGEYYFERREFDQAIEHYSRLLRSWDNPYFEMALYKLGWAYYNVNDYADAISSFVYLIDDVNLLESSAGSRAARSKTDLRKEAIDYIASSFTEFGGPTKAKTFLEPKKDKDYVIPIFLKIADIYNSRNFYAEAIETYQTLLEVFPFYHDAPLLYRHIISTYESAGDEEKTNEAREVLVKNFGPGSAWLAQYPEGEIRSNALNLAQESLYELGLHYQALAQEKGRPRDYRKAIDKYVQYLDGFPQGDKRYIVNFYVAECLYEVGDYEEAAEAYHQCMTQYENDEYKEQAAYNRVLCYYNLCTTDTPKDTVTTYVDDFLGSGVMKTIVVENGYQAQLIEACNDFDRFMPESPKRHEVLMKLGETLYSLGQFDLTVQAYQRVADDSARSEFTPRAMTMIAQSYFKNGQFEESERWYRKLADTFSDTPEYVDRANRMIASSRFKIAESLREAGSADKAANEFEEVAKLSKDEEVAPRALYEAAILYENGEQIDKAINLFEQLSREYPNAESVDEALFKAGVLRQSLEQWEAAARDFLRLADQMPNSNYVPRALYNAGACYENIQEWLAAKRTYERYVALGHRDPDEYLEVLFKIGDMAYRDRDMKGALEGFSKTVSGYRELVRQGRVVDDYVVAHAQFMIGEINFEDYCRIELVPPLEKNLERKSGGLKIVLEAYKEAARFRVAEWAIAASYKIGMAYEEFVRAFLDSPRPGSMTDEELLAYDEKLSETTEPFKVQALETYRANVRRAEEGNIENEWVAESRKRMQALLIELGPDSGLNIDASPGEKALNRATKGG